MRTLPNQGEHKAPSPSQSGMDGVNILGKMGFGEICEFGMLWTRSGWLAWVVLCRGGWCCIVLCGVVVRRVALHCVKLWCGA